MALRLAAALVVATLAVSAPAIAGDAPAPATTTAARAGSSCPLLSADCTESRLTSRWILDSLARDLPSSRDVWSLLETVEPAAIVDRVDGAGLYAEQPGRFSLRGSSWRQNAVLLDGADVTDPARGGVPLFLPDSDVLETVAVTSALAPADYGGAGVTLSLETRAATDTWRGSVQGYGLGSGMQAGESSATPSIARFGSLLDGSALVSGPVAGERLGLLVSGRVARVRRIERAESDALEGRVVSGLARLDWRAGAHDRLRLTLLGQGRTAPLAARARFAPAPVGEHHDSFGATTAWIHDGDRVAAGASAGLWTNGWLPRLAGRAADATLERLRDGPIPELVFPSRSRRSSWSASGWLALRAAPLAGASHAPRFGASVSRAWMVEAAGLDAPLAETVDGLAARVWEYTWPGPESRRHRLESALWASERLAWADRLFVEAGLRLERTTAAAQGAAQDVAWTSLLPRVSLRLRLTGPGRITLRAGWGEFSQRLLLDALAYGDPNAPSAAVYRWDDANADGRYVPAERGTLVARAGPGTAGTGLSAVDPELRPPRARELVAGIEACPAEGWFVSLTGFDRRETDLIETVDAGVTASDYVVRYLPDPGGDIVGPQDEQWLPVFDRTPESFGLDRYRLTNPSGHSSLHQGVELRIEKAFGGRFALFAGATASRTELRGANRGFRVTENDPGLPGELFDDPNADTYAEGRSFFDRAYTLKLAASWHAPRGFRLGVVARYQDGQPFARLVVVPDLAQGPEAIPATTRGQTFGRVVSSDPEGRPLSADGHRFTYTLTVDARLEKAWSFGKRRLALVAEVFNLGGLRHEVEEDPVWGAGFRVPTALQPPQAVRLGARLDF